MQVGGAGYTLTAGESQVEVAVAIHIGPGGGNIAEARQQGAEFLEAAIQRIPHGRIAQQPCDITLLCLQGDE